MPSSATIATQVSSGMAGVTLMARVRCRSSQQRSFQAPNQAFDRGPPRTGRRHLVARPCIWRKKVPTAMYWFPQRIMAAHRWAVTGTPLTSGCGIRELPSILQVVDAQQWTQNGFARWKGVVESSLSDGAPAMRRDRNAHFRRGAVAEGGPLRGVGAACRTPRTTCCGSEAADVAQHQGPGGARGCGAAASDSQGAAQPPPYLAVSSLPPPPPPFPPIPPRTHFL